MKDASSRQEPPDELEALIMKAQAEKRMTQDEARREVATTHPGFHAYEEELNRRADALAKSRYFDHLNKARTTIGVEAANNVRKHESNFSLKCQELGCIEPRYFSSLHQNYPEIERILFDALKGYWHIGPHLYTGKGSKELEDRMRELDESYNRYLSWYESTH